MCKAKHEDQPYVGIVGRSSRKSPVALQGSATEKFLSFGKLWVATVLIIKILEMHSASPTRANSDKLNPPNAKQR
jgi:hypothetical protein